MVAQTNHQLSSYVAENKVDTVIYLRIGKTSKAKTSPDVFYSPFLRIHYYHNKRLQVKES